MKLWRLAVLLVAAASLAASVVPVSARAAFDWMTRPGTIGHALFLPDGSSVYLDAVIADKIRPDSTPPYFVVRECFDQKQRLIVNVPPPAELRTRQTIDVQGSLATLPNGHRAVVNARVLAYTDKDGTVLYDGPLIKGLFEPTPWEWKVELAARSESGESDEPPSPNEPDPAPENPPVYCGTIADAKSQSDGTTVKLNCKPVDSTGAGQFVMAEDTTYDTLKVYYTGAVDETDRINLVSGTMGTEASERVLHVDTDPQGFMGSVQTVAQGTIAWVKTFEDWEYLPADLEDKVVSRVFADGYFHIQEADRSSGIRVYDEYASAGLSPGDTVSIPEFEAEVRTVDGERALYSYWTEEGTPVDPPKPLGLNNRSVGGGDFNVLTVGPSGGTGLNNVGLLVRSWGRVTASDSAALYVDDGSNLDDGSGNAGVRVEGLSGYRPYRYAVGDYVSLSGICGLREEQGQFARVIRVADSADAQLLQTTGPPQGFEVHSTGSGEITCYWRATPGATGYNVYRGTTSGEQDYENPVNGGTPWNTLSYPGSGVYAFTDSGLSNGTEYFYTAKVVRDTGESGPSAEDSDIPDAAAIPWDTRDAGLIIAAVQSLVGVSADWVSVVGPDNSVYCSIYGTLPPEGEVIPGTNLLRYPDDSIVPIPDDGGQFAQQGIESGGDVESVEPQEQNPSDGPYRRVRSEQRFTGSRGYFSPGWYGTIDLAWLYPKDTYWTYLGSRWETGPLDKRVAVDIDAGLQWSRAYRAFNPHMSLKYDRVTDSILRFLAPKTLLPVRFDAQYWYPIFMQYVLYPVGAGKDILPTLAVHGMNQYMGYSTVVLGACNPVKFPTAMMKRVHSIAQGKPPNVFRETGSRFFGAAFWGGQLLTPQWQWVTWTADDTYDHGSYPHQSWRVTWTTPPGREYYEETNIGCDLR